MPRIDMDWTIRYLIDRHPWAEEVLEWHGIPADAQMSVRTACWFFKADQERLVADLEAVTGLRDDFDELVWEPGWELSAAS